MDIGLKSCAQWQDKGLRCARLAGLVTAIGIHLLYAVQLHARARHLLRSGYIATGNVMLTRPQGWCCGWLCRLVQSPWGRAAYVIPSDCVQLSSVSVRTKR
jgi:hypothetical protein